MALSTKQCIQLNQSVFSLANAYSSQMARERLPEQTGLTLSDRSTLMVLGQASRTTIRDLSKRMDINPGTVSVYVQRLVQLGLAKRIQSESDRRTWWLSLTEAGEEAHQDTINRAAQYTRAFLKSLAADEQSMLHGLLIRVVKGLGYAW